VLLFKKVFQLDKDPHTFNVSRDYHRIIHEVEADLTQKVKDQYVVLSKGKDFTIVETAHTLSYGSYTGLSAPHIASYLDCPAVVIAEGDPKKIIDKSIIAQRCFEVEDVDFLGVIVNKASHFDETVREILKERNIPVLGVIPVYEELSTPTCEDIIEELGGELIAGEEGMCNKVKTTIVGAMTYDSAQRTLQQMEFPHNTVMVTGGDRADMQLLAFEINTSLLVLTGSIYPSTTILAKADALKIPVVVVPYDTMTAASKCEEAVAELRPENALFIKEIVGKHVDIEKLLK
jgi:BioD-like phosphotransacetylase family protein